MHGGVAIEGLMTTVTAHEFRTWLLEELRQAGERRSGVSFTVEALAVADVPQLAVLFVGDGPPPPETESIGLAAHRMSRNEASERLRNLHQQIGSMLGRALVLPGAAEYEGTGHLSELTSDADSAVFAASFPVYLGVEMR